MSPMTFFYAPQVYIDTTYLSHTASEKIEEEIEKLNLNKATDSYSIQIKISRLLRILY